MKQTGMKKLRQQINNIKQSKRIYTTAFKNTQSQTIFKLKKFETLTKFIFQRILGRGLKQRSG